MHRATFFLSTGRCGTQWIEHALASAYGDRIEVTHEPLLAGYRPRRYLRQDSVTELRDDPVFVDHLRSIRRTLEQKPYVETGWPCYGALPLLAQELGPQFQVVHLVRNPVRVGLSMATHRLYTKQNWVREAALVPTDPGALQKDLADAWGTMTQYEKCLFWWTEINLYGRELQASLPDVRFHFVRFEDLLNSDGSSLTQLAEFLGLEPEPSLLDAVSTRVDKHQTKTAPVDWHLIDKYPATVDLARQLGYELDELSDADLKQRYFAWRSLAKVRRRLAKLPRHLTRRFRKSGAGG